MIYGGVGEYMMKRPVLGLMSSEPTQVIVVLLQSCLLIPLLYTRCTTGK